MAARALDKLYLLTGAERWRNLADQTLTAFAGAAKEHGLFAATFVRDYGRVGPR